MGHGGVVLDLREAGGRVTTQELRQAVFDYLRNNTALEVRVDTIFVGGGISRTELTVRLLATDPGTGSRTEIASGTEEIDSTEEC